MLVSEGLKLALGPGIKDPISNVSPGLLGLVLSLEPVGLNLLNQVILGSFGLGLGLLALGLKEGAELGGVPALIWRNDVLIPVLFDQILEILAVRRSRIGDVVVGEPTLKLCLVPFVVYCNKELADILPKH